MRASAPRRHGTAWSPLALALALIAGGPLGCACDPSPVSGSDGGPIGTVDGGQNGVVDGGVDAGGRADAGTDAGEGADAGDLDAGGLDGGGALDGGEAVDAGDRLDGGAGTDGPLGDDAGAPRGDAGQDAGASHDGGTNDDAGGVPAGDGGVMETCFPEIYDPTQLGPDYDQFAPVVGSHCMGTNHQDITGVERVVFLGDSITVGSPPTVSSDFYRSLVAQRLADHFGLTPPESNWRLYNFSSGEALVQESGDFASCARWGARTDDLAGQLEDCLPEDKRGEKTLVVMTVGGNDLAKLAETGVDAPYEESFARVEAYVGLLRSAVDWLKAPGRFPNGVHVVFANTYEFTDGTGDIESCPATDLGSFGGVGDFENWPNVDEFKQLALWANEQYMRIAVETGTDMTFLFEHFCGHGFHNDDPTAPCYRGPGTARWFDLTCIHPNPTGHSFIADLFMETILE